MLLTNGLDRLARKGARRLRWASWPGGVGSERARDGEVRLGPPLSSVIQMAPSPTRERALSRSCRPLTKLLPEIGRSNLRWCARSESTAALGIHRNATRGCPSRAVERCTTNPPATRKWVPLRGCTRWCGLEIQRVAGWMDAGCEAVERLREPSPEHAATLDALT